MKLIHLFISGVIHNPVSVKKIMYHQSNVRYFNARAPATLLQAFVITDAVATLIVMNHRYNPRTGTLDTELFHASIPSF